MTWLQIIAMGAAGAAAMRAAFERGDLDEVARQGALAGPAVVARALGSSDRTTQLAAITAAPAVEARAELLAPLARIAAGGDRQTAVPAADTARTIARSLARDLVRTGLPDDLAADDLATWRAAWADLALRGDRGIELRVAALDTAAALDPAGTGVDLDAAFRDPDPAFRRAVPAAVRLPVAPAAYAALAAAIAQDADPLTSLAAAQALCLSIEVSPAPPILGALGPAGLARLRTLVARPPPGAPRPAVRDADRCLAADRSATRRGPRAPAAGPRRK